MVESLFKIWPKGLAEWYRNAHALTDQKQRCLSMEMVVKTPKILVLGPRTLRPRLAAALSEEGMDAVWPDQVDASFPWPNEADSDQKLELFLRAFKDAGGSLVHPGVGLWADRAELLTVAKRVGLTVIAPPAKVVNLFSNKLNLIGEAAQVGIPHLLVSEEPMHSVREVRSMIERESRRFPIVLKSVRGRERHGLYVIHDRDDIESRLQLWLDQLRTNLGEVIFYAERYLEAARMVTVPFCRFASGELQIFPKSDSSLMYQFRKVIEFSPNPFLDQSVETEIDEMVRKLAERINYVGVGSFDFFVDDHRIYFLEGFAHLNLGFPLWERVSKTSAISWQVATMRQGSESALPTIAPRSDWRISMGLRVFSEDPVLQLPQPGQVMEWETELSNAAFDGGYSVGDRLRYHEDGILGILTVSGEPGDSRFEPVIESSARALQDLWIGGTLQTNERFLLDAVQHPWVRSGVFHVQFLEEEFIPEIRPDQEQLPLFAALCAKFVDATDGRWVVGDQWVKWDEKELKGWRETHRGLDYLSGYFELPEGRVLKTGVYPVSEDRWRVRVGSWFMQVRRVPPSKGGKKSLLRPVFALVSGKVHSQLFRPEDQMGAHEPMVLLESLGILVPHALPMEARLVRFFVQPEEWVEQGQKLAEVELFQV